MSSWAKQKLKLGLEDVMPKYLSPLLVPYTIDDVKRMFPTKKLKKPARARAIIKYYETYSWSWWWIARGRPSGIVKRVWTVEDDTAFSGDWGTFLSALEQGLDQRASEAGGGARVTLSLFATSAHQSRVGHGLSGCTKTGRTLPRQDRGSRRG